MEVQAKFKGTTLLNRVGRELRDKVVLITGASEGIGAACARLMAQRGAKLVLTALPGDGFENEQSDSRLIVTGDITEEKTRIEVVEQTIAHFGRIDVLINNAGVGQYAYPSEVNLEISKRIFDINVFSALALTQLVLPHMRSRNSGVVVNMGSVGGRVALPWAVMYSATKWALHCVDDSLHRELLGTGIRVMKVCPGIVDTDFREHTLERGAPGPVEDIRRKVSPDQVAAAIIRGLERGKRTVFVPGSVSCSLHLTSLRHESWIGI